MQYTFRLDKLHVTSKREFERPDKDYLVFAVKVNDQTFVAPASQPPNNGFLWELEAGRDVALYDTGNALSPDTTWEVGPIEVGNDDLVTWTFVIVNSWKGTEADIAKELSAVAGVLLAAGAATLPEGIGIALGILGAIVGGVAAFLPSKPDCDGPVAAELQAMSGHGLQNLDYQNGDQERFHRRKVTYTGEKSPQGCGSPSVDVTHTIATPYAFITTSPPPKLTPAILGAANAWIGTWADKRILEESSIVCRIDAGASLDVAQVPTTGLFGAATVSPSQAEYPPVRTPVSPNADAQLEIGQAPAQHAAAVLNCKLVATLNPKPGVFGNLGSDPLSDDVRPTIVRQALLRVPFSESPGLFAPAGSLARYSVTTIEQEHTKRSHMLAERHADFLVDLPMQATPYREAQYAGATLVAQRLRGILVQTATPTAASQASVNSLDEIAAQNTSALANSQGVVAAPSPLALADTIVVAEDTVLQLYGLYDDSHRLVEHRVRYIRTGTRGSVVTDVMLEPATARPR